MVGQHDDIAGVGGFGGGEDHFNAWVVGCAAAEQGGCAEFAEGAGEAGSLDDGEHGRIRHAFVHARGLGAHVDCPEGADVAFGVELCVGQFGFVGVEVDAQAIAVGREHDGFAGAAFERAGGDCGEGGSERLDFGGGFHDQFGAEAVDAVAVVEAAGEPGGVDCAEVGGGVGDGFAARAGQHAAQGEFEAARAGVDHASVGQ